MGSVLRALAVYGFLLVLFRMAGKRALSVRKPLVNDSSPSMSLDRLRDDEFERGGHITVIPKDEVYAR